MTTTCHHWFFKVLCWEVAFIKSLIACVFRRNVVVFKQGSDIVVKHFKTCGFVSNCAVTVLTHELWVITWLSSAYLITCTFVMLEKKKKYLAGNCHITQLLRDCFLDNRIVVLRPWTVHRLVSAPRWHTWWQLLLPLMTWTRWSSLHSHNQTPWTMQVKEVT